MESNLLRWKLYLPERWREACVLNQDGIMDPNLTLAHVTHNTAVVLLHQSIAYPMPGWQNSRVRLPSNSSSDTCLAAATEVAIIAEKFLQGSTSPTNPQFAFCLFICGRMLLAHSSYYSVPLLAEFDSLVGSLQEMSNRWNGPPSYSDNLASKFAVRLQHAQRQGSGVIDIRQPAYSDDTHVGQQEVSASIANVHGNLQNDLSSMLNGNFQTDGGMGVAQDASPDSISLAFPPLPPAFQPEHPSRAQTAVPSPTLESLQTHAPLLQPHNTGNPAGMSLSAPDMLDFDDLNSYLQQPFLPTQRISMFSEPTQDRGPAYPPANQ